eukprot:scaffold113747_cov78-Phaeocystis_antarctica.AAC.1
MKFAVLNANLAPASRANFSNLGMSEESLLGLGGYMEQGTMPARIHPNIPARNSRPNGYAIITRSPREQSFSISIFATAGRG